MLADRAIGGERPSTEHARSRQNGRVIVASRGAKIIDRHHPAEIERAVLHAVGSPS